MSEITDALAKWIEHEASRNEEGALNALRYDFFEAGYRAGETKLRKQVLNAIEMAAKSSPYLPAFTESNDMAHEIYMESLDTVKAAIQSGGS